MARAEIVAVLVIYILPLSGCGTVCNLVCLHAVPKEESPTLGLKQARFPRPSFVLQYFGNRQIILVLPCLGQLSWTEL